MIKNLFISTINEDGVESEVHLIFKTKIEALEYIEEYLSRLNGFKVIQTRNENIRCDIFHAMSETEHIRLELL